MLFVIAGALFVVGLAMILIGDQLRRREVRGVAVPEKFWDWFLTVVKKTFKILTDQDAGTGAKLAAGGTLLLGASVIAFVAAILVAVGGNGAEPESTTSTTTTTSP